MQGMLSYTPLDMKRIEAKFKVQRPKQEEKEGAGGMFNTILLLLITLSAFILSIVLFILIKKQT